MLQCPFLFRSTLSLTKTVPQPCYNVHFCSEVPFPWLKLSHNHATMSISVQKYPFPDWKRHELGRYFLMVPILKLTSVWACKYAHEWAVLKLMFQCAFHLAAVVCEEITYHFWCFHVYIFFIYLEMHGVLTLVGKIRHYRNDCFYY